MPISANQLNVQALSVEFVDASIRIILDDTAGKYRRRSRGFLGCATPRMRNARTGA